MGLKEMLDERELKICRDTGCDPEDFAQRKLRFEANKRGYGPETAELAIEASKQPRPQPSSRTMRSRTSSSAIAAARPRVQARQVAPRFNALDHGTCTYCGGRVELIGRCHSETCDDHAGGVMHVAIPGMGV